MGKIPVKYTVYNEHIFLEGLGSWGGTSEASRLTLLIRYKVALRKRYRLGGMSRNGLTALVNSMIEKERH